MIDKDDRSIDNYLFEKCGSKIGCLTVKKITTREKYVTRSFVSSNTCARCTCTEKRKTRDNLLTIKPFLQFTVYTAHKLRQFVVYM